MFKKILISLTLLSASNLVCMEEGNNNNNFAKKNKFEGSLTLAKKQKPEAFDKWLYVPSEIWTQVIYFLIQDCKDTKEICKRLKYFALTCKNFKNLIEGQGLTTGNAFIAKEVQRQVNKLLYSTLFKPFF